MLIIFCIGMLISVFLFLLHPFHDLFLLGYASKRFQETYGEQILIDRLFDCIFHPSIGFPSDINEKITGGDLKNILCRRLKTVKVHSVFQQKCYFNLRRIISQYLHDPIVFGKNGRYDPELSIIM